MKTKEQYRDAMIANLRANPNVPEHLLRHDDNDERELPPELVGMFDAFADQLVYLQSLIPGLARLPDPNARKPLSVNPPGFNGKPLL